MTRILAFLSHVWMMLGIAAFAGGSPGPDTKQAAVGPYPVGSTTPGFNNVGVRQVKLTIGTVALKTLMSKPVEIVPAPGPGRTVIVLAVHTFFHHGSQPFSSSGQNAILAYGGNLGSPASSAIGADGTYAGDLVAVGTAYPFNIAGVQNNVNLPVKLTGDSDNGPLGNGSMDLWLWFVVAQ